MSYATYNIENTNIESKNVKIRGKKADYIYVERSTGIKNGLFLEYHVVGQKNVLKVSQYVRETTKLKPWQLQSLDKKLLRTIKKYWRSDTVVTGNERITLDWKMPNELFQIKKQILMQNIEGILKQLCIAKSEHSMKANTKEYFDNSPCGKQHSKLVSRRSFLLVLDSTQWSHKEIEEILWKVQKRYEDIYIVISKCAFSIEDISDYFLEECGVILHIIDEKVAKQMRFHTIFFLLEHCDNRRTDYHFQKKYQLVEWEENQFQSLLFVAQNDTISNGMKRNG